MTLLGRRRRFLIDPLQRRLLRVTSLYYGGLTLLVAAVLYVPRLLVLHGDAAPEAQRRAAAEVVTLHQFFWPAAAALFVLFTVHVVLVSHRLVGPLVQIRRALSAVADGDLGVRVALRKGDDLFLEAALFNDMAAALEARFGAATGAVAEALAVAEAEDDAVRAARGAGRRVADEEPVGAGR